MSEHRCVNCQAPGAEPYDLMLRNNAYDDVYLCDVCFEALRDEITNTP